MARSRWRRRLNQGSGHAGRSAGFTLVEVLVALAVLAVALAAVMRVVVQAIDTTAALRDRGIALGVAQDQLVRHQLMRDWPALDTVRGTREQGGRTWYWQEQVASTTWPQLRRMEVEVRATQEGQVLARMAGILRDQRGTP